MKFLSMQPNGIIFQYPLLNISNNEIKLFLLFKKLTKILFNCSLWLGTEVQNKKIRLFGAFNIIFSTCVVLVLVQNFSFCYLLEVHHWKFGWPCPVLWQSNYQKNTYCNDINKSNQLFMALDLGTIFIKGFLNGEKHIMISYQSHNILCSVTYFFF